MRGEGQEKASLAGTATGFYGLLALGAMALILVAGRVGEARALAAGERGLPFQAAAGLGLGLVLVALSRLSTRLLAPARDLERRLAGLLGWLAPAESLSLALLSGFAEELFFRIALLDLVGPWWSTALFALLHTGPGRVYLLWTLFAAGVGALFAALILQGWGLLAVAAAHALVNVVNLRRLSGLAEREG